MYRYSKSAFLQMTENFELEKIAITIIVDILTQISLTLLTFIALTILQKKKINLS